MQPGAVGPEPAAGAVDIGMEPLDQGPAEVYQSASLKFQVLIFIGDFESGDTSAWSATVE